MPISNDAIFDIQSKRYQDQYSQVGAIRRIARVDNDVTIYSGRNDRSGFRVLTTSDGSISFNKYDSNAQLDDGSVVTYSQLQNDPSRIGTIDSKPN